MAMGSSTGLSPAGMDLGLGSSLAGQVADETEEQRRKRLQMQQTQKFSPSTLALLGPGGLNIGY